MPLFSIVFMINISCNYEYKTVYFRLLHRNDFNNLNVETKLTQSMIFDLKTVKRHFFVLNLKIAVSLLSILMKLFLKNVAHFIIHVD